LSKTVSVLIDGTAVPSELGGVGRYLEGLVGGLQRGGSSFSLVVRAEHAAHFRALAPGAHVVVAPRFVDRRPLRFLWEQTGLVRLRRRLGARVLHSPHYTFPLLSGHGVVTVHDATFFSDPDSHGRLKRVFFSTWIRAALTRRLVCVVPSDATRAELGRHVGASRADVVLAHHGVDRSAFAPPSAADVAAVRELVGLRPGQPYLAFLGTVEPRKNVGALLRAHQQLRLDRGAGRVPDIVVAGARGWDADAGRLLDELGVEQGVHEVGYLDFSALPALLGGAEIFAYPSSAEGFGLPVLEAMASGAVVLTTGRSALPEVGGDAVEYAEPDVDSLRAALARLLDDDARRAELREAGPQRAALFTWEATAAAHVHAYEAAS